MNNFLQGRLKFVRLCLLASTFALVAIGIATIYAVGNPAEPSPASDITNANLWKKQLIFTAIGFMGFIAANLVNYRKLGAVSLPIYGIVLLLLSILLISRYVIGISLDMAILRVSVPEINGAHRWINLVVAGRQILSLQPSEICKLSYVLALAWYLRYRSNYRNFSALIGPFILTLLPMVMILLEPDLGTVMLMMPILFAMLFVAGAKVKHLFMIAFCAVLVSPLLWFKMNPYQQRRISCVLLQNSWIQQKAEQNPRLGKILVGSKFNLQQWKNDWGYHLIRSKFAIASGGVKGNGFRKGPFVKYDFLPYRYNDFIFAAIAHQWGFVGCLGLMMLYVIIIVCGLEIAANNTDPFGRLLAIGIIAVLAVEVLVNVSMTVGLMPITGLTLPLVSYGGSSLLVSMMSIGLLNNVGRCRPFSVARKT
jgi:rod shape determining protein RodA